MTPSAAQDARIHNIGYRRYEGERLGPGHARLALFSHSLRGAFGLGRSARSKVLPFSLFAVMCMPAVVMVAVATLSGLDEMPIEYQGYGLSLQPILGLYIALAAPQMVSLDLRFRTIPLYFSRPMTPTDYVRAKFAALSAALFLFVAVPLTIAYAGGLLAELGFADQTEGYLLGLVTTAVLAVTHAGLALVVAARTPRRGFGVAAIIAVLTIPFVAVTAVQAIASEQGESEAVGWLGLFSPGTLIDGLQSTFLGGSSGFPGEQDPSTAAGVAYLLVTVGLAALSYVLLVRRYRKAGL
ncbi:ABC transporter permease subunit [Streptomyces millisiae]|uniref:ABC transporter permease subunit n=1 Tax=Streptomyces millisiae TaxID=3075542 RepID=A0ABU2LKT9_9ACTN|nr:ABC transporter permease subunit [Streptomyces sp. DSM 44918]MDT0318125.1 ABC transporter permease subunit [Streptomyces sp. DSM 44918]